MGPCVPLSCFIIKSASMVALELCQTLCCLQDPPDLKRVAGAPAWARRRARVPRGLEEGIPLSGTASCRECGLSGSCEVPGVCPWRGVTDGGGLRRGEVFPPGAQVKGVSVPRDGRVGGKQVRVWSAGRWGAGPRRAVT